MRAKDIEVGKTYVLNDGYQGEHDEVVTFVGKREIRSYRGPYVTRREGYVVEYKSARSGETRVCTLAQVLRPVTDEELRQREIDAALKTARKEVADEALALLTRAGVRAYPGGRDAISIILAPMTPSEAKSLALRLLGETE